MDRKTHGLIAATFTPMNSDGSLNLSMVPRIVEHLIDTGIIGMYIAGSTGEGVSLTSAEREQVAEAYVKAAAGRMLTFVQVGQDSVEQARQLAAHAAKIGATAVSAVTPTYFKPTSVTALVEAMAHIAAGAPDLPFYHYHIPTVTGVNLDMVEFLKLGGKRIANLAGLKYTASMLHEYQACLELDGGRFDVLFGFDEMMLGAMAVGSTASVGSTFNFCGPVYQNIIRAFNDGDLETARRWQSRSVQIVRTFVPYGGREAQKAMMKMIGLDCGPTRTPLTTLASERYDKLRSELEAIGFFDLQHAAASH
ncbi:MAG: N-acetylneuraminate lyase [Planctomycetes bacterium]|nr:N-acetylneuraminate lyase [Planctomycetota bacterium]